MQFIYPKARKSSSLQRLLIAALSSTALICSLPPVHAAESAVAVAEFSASKDTVFDLPSGEKVIGGKAYFDRETPNVLTIKQETDRLFIDWHEGFNIGEKSSTVFYQPDSKSIVVNRVVGKTKNPTQILGELRANGNVIILDKNGIIFGKSSTIDVGGIIASTGSMNAKNFMKGKENITIKNAVKGFITNQGTINVSDSGLAAFVAPNVRNDGLIIARKGTVMMGQAQIATLDLYGDGLIEIKTRKNTKKTDIINEGKIDIEGGKVLVTAAYVDGAVRNLVNMTEIAKGENFRVLNGKIIISEVKPVEIVIPTPKPTPITKVAPVETITPSSKRQLGNWVTHYKMPSIYSEDGLDLDKNSYSTNEIFKGERLSSKIETD